ncbi:MAG: cupin domain-containing protein [Gemmatimonadota bacterium]
MTQQDERPDDRLREPPAQRFAGDSHQLDLLQALADLRAEEHEARSGHRQITVFRRAPVTHVLFAFEAGGQLNQHSTPGLVTIHVLEGRIRVRAEDQDHELAAGGVLILSPEVAHDVRALEASGMLLSVHLESSG